MGVDIIELEHRAKWLVGAGSYVLSFHMGLNRCFVDVLLELYTVHPSEITG